MEPEKKKFGFIPLIIAVIIGGIGLYVLFADPDSAESFGRWIGGGLRSITGK